MKKPLFIFLLCLLDINVIAQTDSLKTVPAAENSTRPRAIQKPLVKPAADTLIQHDSLQTSDTIDATIPDTAKAKADTVKILIKPQVAKKPFDSFYRKLLDNPYLKTTGKPLYLLIKEKQRHSKDEMFYLLTGLLLLLASIRLVFSQYFTNIFRLLFQPTFRQKQTREQLLQSNLPSFLLNLFFIVSGGAYISFLISHYHFTQLNFWWLLIYSTIALLVLYSFKFIILTFAGWVFNVKEAADTYVFIVYLINKILGVLLVPFTMLIAFSKDPFIDIAITISLILIGILFIYRYFVSLAPVRKEVQVSLLHFVFYILAFEITPLLLIYKTLVFYLNKSL